MNPFEMLERFPESSECVLIGAFAMHFYGVDRQTADVDFLISKEKYLSLAPKLEKAGGQKVIETTLFSRWLSAGTPRWFVDFLFVDTETFAGVLSEARSVEVKGRKFLVPSLNHLMALKLHALTQDPRRELSDLADLVRLIRANHVDVSDPKFHALCLKYSRPEIYEQIKKHSGPL